MLLISRLPCPARHARGFSLIEFMIAITLSLLVTAALSAAFVASSRSRAEIERANQQIENGRYALQLLTDDLELAGFYSYFDITNAQLGNPDTKPNPCTAVIRNPVDPGQPPDPGISTLNRDLPIHVQGYDNPAALDADLDDCLSDLRPRTDIVVIRRAATCEVGAANCALVDGAPYFQALLCSDENELNSTAAWAGWTSHYRLDVEGSANLDRTNRGCAAPAPLRQYLTHIYFIANNDIAGDGIPTLKRAELGADLDGDLNADENGDGIPDFGIVPLAHGIQEMELEYGIDTTGDGQPEAFTSNPDAYISGDCPVANDPKCIGNWRNVTAVKINILARNVTETRDYSDTKTYTLGMMADGVTANTIGPFNDGYKRHAYQTVVRLHNPASRRE